MSGLNKVLLIGHLGKDPELTYTQDGLGILKFSLATSENYTDKSGEKVENTTWHNVVLFGKMAETLANYLAKGKQTYVEGKIRNSSYDDKDGIKRYKTEIIASNIVLLGKKDENDSQGEQQDERQQQERPQTQNRQNAQQGQKNQGRQQADEFDDGNVPF
ncbi:MAG: single-stranded DNA-binding protein [bacterium]